MAERVTIKSIAKDLGISHMTVSRALSNHPNVLKETREMVQKRAREMGYVKSAAAKAMRGDGTRIVGLLLPNIVNEFYARFANTLALACEAESLQLIIHLTGDDIHAEAKAIERLQEIQAQGVVMVPAPGDRPYSFARLKEMRVIQLIRQADLGEPVDAILVDDSAAITAAVRHLANLGHKQIAYIGADKELSSGRSRLTAFKVGLVEAGLDASAELVRTAPPSAEMGQRQMEALLEVGKASAVVCGGVEISNGALQAILSGGHKVDNPVAFVGYGDALLYAWIGKGVTTIDLPVEALASEAAALLSEKRDIHSSRTVAFPATLVCR
ncbi:LacI family transcriptional regulator [Shimia isoporae]|uniref:LacI family transcriptional regulator n=1 Tax=Shimia isoporae TaxID=647720 RepID=A0A4R1N2E7_9RHOB|nr:LacI family DNA-binding transcriptional regulator [Shimia isoporae]TCL00551.1 LacI family transcriptional regulator [Shimia isoporae]